MGDRGHVKTVGKPNEVAPHVRFDERRLGRLRLSQSSTLLGFTHICGKTRAGEFQVLRKTVSERRRTKLREFNDELKQRRHLPIPEQGNGSRARPRATSTITPSPATSRQSRTSYTS